MLGSPQTLGRAAPAHRASHRCAKVTCSAAVSTPTTLSPSQRIAFKSDPSYTFAPIINGCWQLAGGHGNEVFNGIGEKLESHAAAGLTTYDTADIYGPSEEILGQFQRAHAAAGGAPVQIFTKYVPNIFQQRPTPASVEAAVRRSLAKLQVDKLDLVQMHWWDYGIPGMADAALALADLQAKGLIRFVGTTNMDTQALAKIVDAGVDVAVNQVQFSLLDRRPLNGMVQYCSERGIKIFAYGSVGGGLLSDRYYEAPKPPGLFGGKPRYNSFDLNTSSLKMYWNVCKQFGGQDLWRELLEVLNTIAQKHNVSIANVSVRWIMQQGDGKTVYPLVGLRGTRHIADNLRALSLQLDAEDNAAIQQVLSKSKGPTGDCYSFERGN